LRGSSKNIQDCFFSIIKYIVKTLALSIVEAQDEFTGFEVILVEGRSPIIDLLQNKK